MKTFILALAVLSIAFSQESPSIVHLSMTNGDSLLPSFKIPEMPHFSSLPIEMSIPEIKAPQLNLENVAQFFQGWSDGVGLPDAGIEVIECLGSDIPQFVRDLEALFHDLSHGQFVQGFLDLFNLYQVWKELRPDCFNGRHAFFEEFKPFIQALQSDRPVLLENIKQDLLANPIGALVDGYGVVQGFLQKNHEAAGYAFGELTAIALSSYLNQTGVNEWHEFSQNMLTGDINNFWYGFVTVFGLGDAYRNFGVCFGQDFPAVFGGIGNIIKDLWKLKFKQAYKDYRSLQKNWEALGVTCWDDGVKPYIAEFSHLLNSLIQEPWAVASGADHQFHNNPITDALDWYFMITNMIDGNWETAGVNFGNWINMLGQGYIGPTEEEDNGLFSATFEEEIPEEEVIFSATIVEVTDLSFSEDFLA